MPTLSENLPETGEQIPDNRPIEVVIAEVVNPKEEPMDTVAREGNAAVGIAISFGVVFLSALLWILWQAILPVMAPTALKFGTVGIRALHGLRWFLPFLVYAPPAFGFWQVRQKAPLAFGAFSRMTSLMYGLGTPILFVYLW